jgi:hypothetical protein
MGRIWKEAVIVAYFKVLSRYSPGRTDEVQSFGYGCAVMSCSLKRSVRSQQFQNQGLSHRF